MALIVFTHGLGAREGFWGSTIDAFQNHEDVTGHNTESWSYRTSKKPVFWETLTGCRYQSLSEIGEQLWSTLRSWSDSQDEIILVGHSMGGLVTAAALVHGFTSGESRDVGLRNKLRGLICIASPFFGASNAKKLDAVYRSLGQNRHIADLRPDSERRKQVVQDFTRSVLALGQLTFVLMRASDDALVLPGEITTPFSHDQYQMDVLSGGHSDCIRNLDTDHPNLVTLVRAIKGILDPASNSKGTGITLFESRAVTIREEYHKRLSAMQSHLDILAWGLASFREDYGNQITQWADDGIRVRLLLVNPDSPTGEVLCQLQDEVEGRQVGSTASDVKTFLSDSADSEHGFELRVSNFHPGINMFRVDGDMFFGPYLAGTVSRNAPTGIVSESHWLYSRLLSHFEWMWEKAEPWPGYTGSA